MVLKLYNLATASVKKSDNIQRIIQRYSMHGLPQIPPKIEIILTNLTQEMLAQYSMSE